MRSTAAARKPRPEEAPIARLAHVTLRYGDVCALDDVSFEAYAGERICVLGANGSGKSTLASVLAGTLAPDEGRVMLVEKHVFSGGHADFQAYREARRNLGLVFQNPDDQIVTSVVEEDVAFGPENLGLSPQEIGERVAEELSRVAMLGHAKSDPRHLSGGQKQRVAIAGALALHPRLLVLDEPGALLDVRGRRGIMRVMGELRDMGMTIVHITHFMEEALEADRVIVLDHGRIVANGTPERVFARGDRLTALGLEVPFVVRLSEALRAKGMPVPWTCSETVLRAALVGDPASSLRLPVPLIEPEADEEPADGSEIMISAMTIDHVSFSYGHGARKQALDDVSFAVQRGSTVAIIGQTGSGKSTLARLMCALDVPDAGRVLVGGTDTSRRRDHKMIHRLVGYVMQHPERQLFAETVYDDVSYGPKNLGLTADEVDQRTRHALELVGLAGREAYSPFHLSGGQQRLCAIAGILAMEPQILVLDEPTAGLDPRGRAQLERILDSVNEGGTSVVRITHSMDVAARCDSIIVLQDGRVLLEGTPQEVFAERNETLLHDAGLGLPHSLLWARWIEQEGIPPLGDPMTLEALVGGLAFRARQIGWQLIDTDEIGG